MEELAGPDPPLEGVFLSAEPAAAYHDTKTKNRPQNERPSRVELQHGAAAVGEEGHRGQPHHRGMHVGMHEAEYSIFQQYSFL